jgi:heat shock protein HtpX
VQMMVIAVIIAGVGGFFAELFFRSFTNFGYYGGYGGGSWSSSSSSSSSSSDSNRKNSGGGAVIVIILAVALIALAWLLSQLVRLALSRSRELLADAGSVELTKNPDAMISALRKIENRGELPGATSAVMELCLDNPREGFADLFATHPSVDSRVQALVKYAGGHDPGPLALPSDTPNGPGDQPQPSTGEVPPPLPKGPWSDATDPAGASQNPSQGPLPRSFPGSLGQPRRPVGPPLRRSFPSPGALTTLARLSLTVV